MAAGITTWKILRRATGWPEIYVADCADLLVSRLDAIENGRVQPTDVERFALRAVLVGSAEPQPAGSPLEVGLLEAVTAAAKDNDIPLTSELARDLVVILRQLVTSSLRRAFGEPEYSDTAQAGGDRG